MAKKIDLRVNVCGITFKNPMLPASSEVARDVKSVKKCIEHGCGGVVLKSTAHPSVPIAGRTPIPNLASLRPLGAGFRDGFLADPVLPTMHPNEYIDKELPEIVKVCRDAEVPLVGSIVIGEQINHWVEYAQRFADKGVDMLELNFGCPHGSKLGGRGKMGKAIADDLELSVEIIKAVKKAVGIPISIKMSPLLEPPNCYAEAYKGAGADALSAHNTPVGLAIDVDREEAFGTYSGGYAPGRAFLPWSLARLNEIMKTVSLPISGIGGIFQADDAIQYLLLGCSTIQVCSAIYVHGYNRFNFILDGITTWMERKGYTNVEEFRGKVKFKEPSEMPLPEAFQYQPPDVSPWPATVEIDKGTCNMCGVCAEACLNDALEIIGKKTDIEFHADKCYNCGICIGLCPTGALKLVDRRTQELIWDGRGTQKKIVYTPNQ